MPRGTIYGPFKGKVVNTSEIKSFDDNSYMWEVSIQQPQEEHEKSNSIVVDITEISVVVDFLFIVTPIVGVCNCSMFCCTLLYVPSSFAIILMGWEREGWLLCLVCLPDVS